MSDVLDILIPTCNRITALAVTLTGLLGQTETDFDVIVADQGSGSDPFATPELQTVVRALALRGCHVDVHRRPERRGMAEQRDFLLRQSQAEYVLYLDDDLLLEPWVVQTLLETMRAEHCGFVGMPPIGLSFADDRRPQEQQVELWDGPVEPERFGWDEIPWERHRVHNAANPLHVQEALGAGPDRPIRYKVAWVGASVLYDRRKLQDVGGFGFWRELPPSHCGEDVLVEVLLLRKYGGCGVLPSGVYHQELPTEVRERTSNTNDLIRRALAAEQTEESLWRT